MFSAALAISTLSEETLMIGYIILLAPTGLAVMAFWLEKKRQRTFY
jgi:hypothetical protein